MPDICSDWFDLIVSNPLPDCRAKFLSHSEKLSTIVGQVWHVRLPLITFDYYFSPNASSHTGTNLHPIKEIISSLTWPWLAGIQWSPWCTYLLVLVNTNRALAVGMGLTLSVILSSDIRRGLAVIVDTVLVSSVSPSSSVCSPSVCSSSPTKVKEKSLYLLFQKKIDE